MGEIIEDMENSRKEDKKFNKYACLCAIVASTTSIVFGYDNGVMSGALIFIKEDLKISDVEEEVLVGILNICALFGSLIAGRMSDRIGRRYTILLSFFIFMLGAILMGYGPDYGVLLAGRCIAGLGVGFALMIAPTYSAEISSATSRGFLTSLPELCLSFGMLLGYVSNYFFGKLALDLGWRLMLGVAAIPSVVVAFGVLKMPESPRWLVLQGRLEEAKKALSQISNTKEEAEERFQDIKKIVGVDENCSSYDATKPANNSHGEGVWKELILRPKPAVRWILIAAVGIHVIEHTTGIEAVLLYGPRIFKKAGITKKDHLLLTSIGVGLTKITFILLSTFLVDRVGRRPLLLTSVGGMVVSLTTLGFTLTMAENSQNKLLWALCLSIVATYTYVAFFSIGIGPITWVYSSEILPSRLRAQGLSLCIAVNRLTTATISMSFISIYKAITIGGTFFMFAGIGVAGWLFFFFMLPETKGKSLEEIEALFNKRSGQIKDDDGIEIQPTTQE